MLNVDYKFFNNATRVEDVKVPATLEIDKINPLGKVVGWDFSDIQSQYFECQ